MTLADNECIPCRGGIPPLTEPETKDLHTQLEQGWELTHDFTHLEKAYAFANFIQAMDFANALTQIAEDEGHHPDLHIRWGQCIVDLWTHKIDGLTKSDFFMAAKADRAFKTISSAHNPQ